MRRLSLVLLTAAPLWLAGCDMLGLESTTAVAARRDAEGRAVGGACRHAARSIEQCYALNKRADKAAVFAGWREMNDYMRENKIDAVPPTADPALAANEGDKAADPSHDGPAAARAGKKGS
jgi:hypothetical protein